MSSPRKCSQCGEYRFRSPAQSSCHERMNHATVVCGCGSKFLDEKSLQEHEKIMKQNQKSDACSDCCRSFETARALNDHRRSKGHNPPIENTRCDCGKLCKSPSGLEQHKRDKQMKLGVWEPKYKSKEEYYDKFYKEKVMVDKADKKKSVERHRQILDDIMKDVRKQEGGGIYSTEIRKAGSHATGTKVGKADEFDTNIPLTVSTKEVKTIGTVNYIYKDKLEPRDPKGPQPNNLNVKRTLVPNPKGKQHHIPLGCATVTPTENIPGKFTYSGDLIARKVKEDLYDKMKASITRLGYKDVHLSRNAHGPALTLTIKGGRGKHDINVDVTPTIDVQPVPVGVHGWPRPDTMRVLPQDTIDRVKSKGTHLVAKGDEFWNISFSKAEKELMAGIDSGNQCRRTSYKMLKTDLKTWQSRSKDGIPGVSSHVLKHAMFWMNEKFGKEEGYWKHENIHTCYTDCLKSLKSHLDQSKLPNYFNPMENLLRGKDKEVLYTLAGYVERRRDELIHMKVQK